jgi:hypothetical protein
MIKLVDILKEIQTIQYTKPNFEFEWGVEAKRYREFRKMGKEEWVDLASKGYTVKYSEIKDVLGNVDLDFDNLENDKKSRFNQAYESGKIEMPLVVKFSDNDYDLIGGNTRIAGLVNKNIDPTLWVVELK